jgi:NAD(P)-dependent dehydrogenase (short-subunit alcohol dehydrogenase family)
VILTKTMALELVEFGIHVNAVALSYFRTPMSAAIDSDEVVGDFADRPRAPQLHRVPAERSLGIPFTSARRKSVVPPYIIALTPASQAIISIRSIRRSEASRAK